MAGKFTRPQASAHSPMSGEPHKGGGGRKDEGEIMVINGLFTGRHLLLLLIPSVVLSG